MLVVWFKFLQSILKERLKFIKLVLDFVNFNCYSRSRLSSPSTTSIEVNCSSPALVRHVSILRWSSLLRFLGFSFKIIAWEWWPLSLVWWFRIRQLSPRLGPLHWLQGFNRWVIIGHFSHHVRSHARLDRLPLLNSRLKFIGLLPDSRLWLFWSHQELDVSFQFIRRVVYVNIDRSLF